MGKDQSHKAFLRFIAKIADISAAYSKDELHEFLDMAHMDFSGFEKLIREYCRLAKISTSHVTDRLKNSRGRSGPRLFYEQELLSKPHLFDLLRSKEIFSTNAELAEFAMKILPSMTSRRFDKMSRADIAGRIVEFIERSKPRKRELLEKSMRDALVDFGQRGGGARRQSFFRKWESIVKDGNI